MVDTAPKTAKPRPRRDRAPWWKRLLGPCILVLLLGGLGWRAWWLCPRPLHHLADYQCADDFDTLIPLTTGFLYIEGATAPIPLPYSTPRSSPPPPPPAWATIPRPYQAPPARTIVLRDWHGVERWRVALPVVKPGVFSSDFAVSPDGCLCATLELRKTTTCVRLYREGALYATHLLPVPLPQRGFTRDTNLKMLNDGRALVTVELGSHARVFLLREGAVLAQGAIIPACIFTPDASAVVTNGQQYAPVVIAHGVLKLGKLQSITDGLSLKEYAYDGCDNYTGLFYPNLVVADDGAIYSPAGRQPNPLGSGWARGDTISPNARYTYYTKDGADWIYSPATGQGWRVRIHGQVDGYDVTDDGRYALVSMTNTLPQSLTTLGELLHLPPPADGWLAIYERPGHLRASLRIPDNIHSWWLSPDGHSLVIMTYNSQVHLYRW